MPPVFAGSILRLSSGKPLILGRELGRGGEGVVFAVPGREDAVAKVWHAAGGERADKLAAMLALPHAGLRSWCAWPEALLLTRDGQAAGFVMARLAGEPLHRLITPHHRKRRYPGRDWRFIVHVAGNLATAIANVHEAGAVIGDVNENGFRVSDEGLVRVLDCDSFQIAAPDRMHRCMVGVADFTPPELQGFPGGFSAVERSPDHDRFGLAVLLFKLLMMGRHPYAGSSAGSGDHEVPHESEPGLGARIRNHEFAYGPMAAAQGIAPPPGALHLDDLDAGVADLFRAAFAADAPVRGRPSASAWHDAMVAMGARLRPCRRADLHVRVDAQECPWCRIGDGLGLELFSHTVPPSPSPPIVAIAQEKPVPVVMAAWSSAPPVSRARGVLYPVPAPRQANMRTVALVMGLAFTCLWLMVVKAWLDGTGNSENDFATVITMSALTLPFWLILGWEPLRRFFARIAQGAKLLAMRPGAAIGALVLVTCVVAGGICLYGMITRPGAWGDWLLTIPGVCAAAAWSVRRHLAAGRGLLVSMTITGITAIIRQRWIWAVVLCAVALLALRLIVNVLGSAWFPIYHHP